MIHPIHLLTISHLPCMFLNHRLPNLVVALLIRCGPHLTTMWVVIWNHYLTGKPLISSLLLSISLSALLPPILAPPRRGTLLSNEKETVEAATLGVEPDRLLLIPLMIIFLSTFPLLISHQLGPLEHGCPHGMCHDCYTIT